ncbi:MAG: hypothetical protein KDB88_08475, partial [Flavobacteriales bacterium]|nr:hypothetical protein [Flavobacteriales bacterium]
LHGVQRLWHRNGTLIRSVNYSNGVLHGDVEEHDGSGRPVLKARYELGSLDGPFKRWRREDTLVRGSYVEGWYTQGKRTGTWTSYYGNGGKASEGSFRNGRLIGGWTRWDREGNKRDP